jgi:drug/metabolite transporter (DMT)-like permease
MQGQPNKYFPPATALLFAAVIWGTIWYPYRLLEAQGLLGTPATFLTYLVTFALAIIFFAKSWRECVRAPVWFFALAMAAGWTNYAYVMGTLEGEVMRVLLLFYLAPVWTLPLARWILGERPSLANYLVVSLALIGAITMLWRPEIGWPVPRGLADWYGLSAGFAFALNNVIALRLKGASIGAKALTSCVGVLVISGVAMVVAGQVSNLVHVHSSSTIWLVIGVGIALFCTSLLVFYALAYLPAIRAIVIMLFELIVGAVTSSWLAGESMSPREWIGGTLIIAATVFSALPERQSPAH